MSSGTTDLGLVWLLEQFLGQTPGARHALLLSGDGLPMCRSSSLDRTSGEHLAAVASGLQGLARVAYERFGDGEGGVRTIMIDHNGGILLIVAAGQGAHLAVLAEEHADTGIVGHQMVALVDRMGEHLTAPPREPETGQRA
jgi:predicted regulator of Ras-like GTPase activity (Roadblock/LC7/MglB family)